jgi:hypothetical protein
MRPHMDSSPDAYEVFKDDITSILDLQIVIGRQKMSDNGKRRLRSPRVGGSHASPQRTKRSPVIDVHSMTSTSAELERKLPSHELEAARLGKQKRTARKSMAGVPPVCGMRRAVRRRGFVAIACRVGGRKGGDGASPSPLHPPSCGQY